MFKAKELSRKGQNMFIGLGGIFSKNTPRHAEKTDTRQAIRRHDPDQQGRGDGEREPESEDLYDMQDSATVSIEALRIFLKNFLDNMPENTPNTAPAVEQRASDHANTQSNAPVPGEPLQADMFGGQRPTEEKPHMDPAEATKAAYAANAYQNTSHVHDDRKKAHLLAERSLDEGPAITLDATHVRTIHIVLDDLKVLLDNDIDYLYIERSDSFLDSIVNAVNDVKMRKNIGA